MLLIARSVSQKVVIGPGVVVTIAEIKDGRVKFAIEAPKDVRVRRQEKQK